MSCKNKLLVDYEKTLQHIRTSSQQMGIGDQEFQTIYDQSIKDVYSNKIQRKISHQVVIAVLVVVSSLLFLKFECLSSICLCHIQECIYPGLKILRKLSIPVIKMFPSLTELYDESCLLQNPYFHIVDMDCWPCNSVDRVIELNDPVKQPLILYGEPYMYKTNQRPVSPLELQNMYKEKASIFNKDAAKLILNTVEFLKVKDVIGRISTMDITNKSYVWRMNRIGPAQALRKLIPRPLILPHMGLSTERFIIIEGSGLEMASKFPDPECNNVFLLQGYGERLIELSPANECIGSCKPFTFLLQQSYLLIYNWWYWRPVSRNSSNNNSTSVIYMGSFC